MLKPISICLALAALAVPSPAAAGNPGGGLVIVAPARLAAALADFVAHKETRLPARLVTLEEALARGQAESGAAGEAADDPERLKRFLYRAWREERIGYALLVGDADALPVRYMVLDRVTEPAFHYAFYPSDLYYADLARRDGGFDDWNASREGFHARYFGEVRGEHHKDPPMNFDGIDYRPEIAVGRWPASTPEAVRTIAAKTIAYERGVESGRGAGRRRAALVAVGGWVDSRALLDRAAARLPVGWQAAKRYYQDGARPAIGPEPSEPDTVALLNEGVGLLLHAGHGSDHAMDGCLATGSLARLHNADRLPVMFSVGCSTARFATLPPYEAYVDVDGQEHAGTNHGEVFREPPPPPAPYQRGVHNPTGFGEQVLVAGPSGAVAYIGCNTGSQPCALTLLDGFVGALERSPAPRLGDCWAAAVSHYWTEEGLERLRPSESWYPASIFFQGMKFMLYGDPSLAMPRPGTRL